MSAGPSIDALDRMAPDDCVEALGPLFEHAPRFLARLCARRPFGSDAVLFATARAVAHDMPEDEQIELIDAHPRLGAPPGSVSPMSYVEQGYDHEGADAAADAERELTASDLERLNEAYEAHFGFRYCVFVAGRPRAELLPGFEAALGSDRRSELHRALDAVVDIAGDRYRKASLGR